MKIIYLLIFAFISSQSLNIETINLEFGKDDFYIIKNTDSNLKLSYINKTTIGPIIIHFMPRKYLNLIKLILISRKKLFNCRKKFIINNGVYETFICDENKNNRYLGNIKLNFNLNNSTITLKGTELFLLDGKYLSLKFYTNGNVEEVKISKKK